MRAFLGISLPVAIHEALHVLQRELATSHADVKWVEPQHLHLTLKFLGEISDTQRHDVEAMLARVAAHHAPFLLSLEGLGAFPSIQFPRVIWIGCAQGSDTVVHLAQAIEQEGHAIPLPAEERSFSAHLTLGRVRSSRRLQLLVHQLRAVRWQPPPAWQVTSLSLYQSELSSSGPRYTVLADVPLVGER